MSHSSSASRFNLQFVTENQAEGGFSVEAYLRWLEAIVKEALSDGYDRLWVLGEGTWVVENAVDIKAWFATESEVNELAPRYPQFIMCLYDLDRWAGELIMSVLKTRPRIFINGLILNNPYYVPLRQSLGSP